MIVMNVLALLAALYYGWDLFTLMLLYWLETAVIGFFTVLKLLHTGRFLAIFIVPFFLVHFGMFMFVHLNFLFALFGDGTDLLSMSAIPEVMSQLAVVALPAVGLFASHLYSFLINYLDKREFYSKGPMEFFFYPYPRVIVMHLTIIFGGFISMFLTPSFALVLLSGLKTITDVSAHRRIHHKKDRMWHFKRLR